MQVLQIPTAGYQSNCWLLVDEKSKVAAIVDPSAEVESILSQLQACGATLQMILLTHGHFDHIFGVDHLRQITGAPVLIHEKDAGMLLDGIKNASAVFFSKSNTHLPSDKHLKGGDALPLGEHRIIVRHMPGHTPGSVIFVLPGMLFTGDTLFKGSVGRTDLPGGSQKQLNDSLKRICFMPGEYTVYAGHGDVTTLNRERKCNPYLQNLNDCEG